MADLINLADYRLSGPAAVQALLAAELAPGISVHDAAWVFAMSEQEYQQSDADPEQMGQLLQQAGLAWFGGNYDQPATLVLHNEVLFRQHFRQLPGREAAMNALGTGIQIRREPERCA